MPAEFSQSRATVCGSGRSGPASRALSWVSWVVSMAAEIWFSVSVTRGSDDLARLTSGTTFWAAKFDRGSSSTTKSFSGIEASVVNRSAAWTVPSRSAATVSGPPASRARNSLKVQL